MEPKKTGIGSKLDNVQRRRNRHIRARHDQMKEQGYELSGLVETIAQRDRSIETLNHVVTERDRCIFEQSVEMGRTREEIVALNQKIAELEQSVQALNQMIMERDQRNHALDMQVTPHGIDSVASQDSNQVAPGHNQANQSLIASPVVGVQLHHVSRSSALKIMRLPRFIRTSLITGPFRFLLDSLPVSTRRRLKDRLFNSLPYLFSGSNSYRQWRALKLPLTEKTLSSNQDAKESAGNSDYVPLLRGAPPSKKPAKLICFYLPQFHAIPENDAWWGEGFTEWTNVKPAQPQFEGHYQPHIPGELGYYDLLDTAVQRRQVELAKLYGIEGFCFYFYWFGGKRLLEAPVLNYLNDSSLDLPFALCWANENWSRRWDGLDSEILIAQQHSSEDDFAFIEYISKYLRDPRYIRIDGKPLLLVYRPNLLPSAKKTAARWRSWCRRNGIGEIYLAYTQSFEVTDPADYGFDAAIEFPPNNSAPPDITKEAKPLVDSFGCKIYDWQIFVERSRNYQKPAYQLFRSVCPSWDNTARRMNNGTVFLNSAPQGYQEWLTNAIAETCARIHNPEERLIFVNSWNEWAEGAHLEPDERYGYAYLQVTRNALTQETYILNKRRKVVLVAHDAYPHGAQLLALNLAKTLSKGLRFQVDLVCLGDGPLKSEYAKWATLYDLAGVDARGPEAVTLVKKLYQSGNRVALVNTTVSGYFLETLSAQGFECVALIHELSGVLKQFSLHGQAETIANFSNKIVFPATEVAASFSEVVQVNPNKVVIRPQGLYKRRGLSANRTDEPMRLREKLSLPADSRIILGVGYADYRKGIDLFVEAGLKLAKRIPSARWVWIGHWEENMLRTVEKRLAQFPELKDRFIFPGLQSDTDLFYGGADVFALTSREDPFPSVLLEALDAGLPIVAFAGAGGFEGLLREGCGKLVAQEDAGTLAAAVGDMIESPRLREVLGQRGKELINERFSFRHYIYDLLDLLGIRMERVSVIVPNYNYAQYLPERLGSIIGQTYPIYEIIFLDDCSTDNSVSVAREILESSGIDYKIIVNDDNSGSVFKQWKKGVELASGTHVWIAEADDSCSAGLLEKAIDGFRDPGVVLSYCESQQMAEDGGILSTNYLDYVMDIDPNQWQNPYVRDGLEEIRNSLSIKNTIPNVSAVIFEKHTVLSVLEKYIEMICSYRIAGDWLVYILMLMHGKIAFTPSPLNNHRRHTRGITIGNFGRNQLDEISRVQEFVAERYGVPAEKYKTAKEYIKTLSRQFGLDVN